MTYMHDDDDDDDDDGDDQEIKNSTVILCLQLIQIETLVFLVEVPAVLERRGVDVGGVKGHL